MKRLEDHLWFKVGASAVGSNAVKLSGFSDIEVWVLKVVRSTALL
jgi:hypothetical protein